MKCPDCGDSYVQPFPVVRQLTECAGDKAYLDFYEMHQCTRCKKHFAVRQGREVIRIIEAGQEVLNAKVRL